MSNLDYELMLEECVEGTFFERGPSGVIKKNSEQTPNNNDSNNDERKVSEKERFKKAMKYAAIAGVSGFALLKIVEKCVYNYAKGAKERTEREIERLNELDKRRDAYYREFNEINDRYHKKTEELSSKMMDLITSRTKKPGDDDRFIREYELAGERLAQELDQLSKKYNH